MLVRGAARPTGRCLQPCIPACVAQARCRRNGRRDHSATCVRAKGETRFDSGAAGRTRVFAFEPRGAGPCARSTAGAHAAGSCFACERGPRCAQVPARDAGTGRLHVPMRGSSTASASRRATGESFTSHARRDVAAVSGHLPTDLSSIHPHPLWMTGRLVGRAARVKRAARAPAQSKTSAGTRTAPSISTRAERDMIAFDTVHWPSTSSASAPTRSVPDG